MSPAAKKARIVSQPGIVAGRPHLVKHRMTVQHIAVLRDRLGQSVEVIAANYGLRPADVQEALEYYAAHRDEIDGHIAADDSLAADVRVRTPSKVGKPLGEAPQIRFYLDETIPRGAVEALRQEGLDVLTAVEAMMLGSTDDQQLSFALAYRRVAVTRDISCLQWHAAGMFHKGLVYAPPQVSEANLVRTLKAISTSLTPDDMIAHVEFVDED